MHHSELHAAGFQVFPVHVYPDGRGGHEKRPRVPKGTSWREWTYDPNSPSWQGALPGLMIPPGVVVLDLDTYKGGGRHELPEITEWDAALIQRTVSGGEHYAFAVPAGLNLTQRDLSPTINTRSTGHGFICTGDGYTPAGRGVFRMLNPAALPSLPDTVIARLLPRERSKAPPGTELADSTVIDMLRHIDPGMGRKDWFNVGAAIRAHLGDDADPDLFIRWSQGEFWLGGCPDNADSEERLAYDWGTFKADGAVSPGTLWHYACKGGWSPPPSIDVAKVFGGGDFSEGLAEILETGADPAKLGANLNRVNAVTDPLSRTVLRSALKKELKAAGLLDKALTAKIDGNESDKPAVTGEYGKNHTRNAEIFIATHYPNGSLVQQSEILYRHDGRAWQELTQEELTAQVTRALMPSYPQDAVYTCTERTVRRMSIVPPGTLEHVNPDYVAFNNGVLRLSDGALIPGSPSLSVINARPYDYAPGSFCPTWLKFLDGAFEGDQERVNLLQEWCGYLMVPTYEHQNILVLIGIRRSGKGTVGRVLRKLVGPDASCGGSLLDLIDGAKLASMTNKSMMFIGDAQPTFNGHVVHAVAEKVRNVSGCDELTLRRPYQRVPMNMPLPTRLVIACNKVPRLFDDSGALAARIIPIPFNTSYGGGREDPHLLSKLEAEIEGIACWALQGLSRLRHNGQFSECAASRAELHAMAEVMSPLNRFIEESVEFGPDQRIAGQDLYNAYQQYCVALQEIPIAPRAFATDFFAAARGRGVKRHNGTFEGRRTRGFTGAGLQAPLAAVK